MDDNRIMRLAESVALAEYPRIEMKTTVSIPISDGVQDIQVWVVDGEYVRTFIDEEFTNFAQHYRFPFIPENEFWLDRETVNDESAYFIGHLIVEWSLMRQGKSYEEAIVEADKAEKVLRRKDNDIVKVIDPRTKLIDPKKFRVKLLKALGNGVKVWLVDGRLVRSILNIDFTQGGHEYVYEYVPENDVWIDNDINWTERGFVILHELHERNRMEEGLDYEEAHAESSALELSCRRQIDDLHDSLMAEGWS
jgi:hypothetical protein